MSVFDPAAYEAAMAAIREQARKAGMDTRRDPSVPVGAEPLGQAHQAAVLRQAGQLPPEPPKSPPMTNGLAAARLDQMSRGVEAMRNDGPGEAAARELDQMRGGIEGMRRGGPPTIDDAIAARIAEDQRGDAANAMMGAATGATTGTPTPANVDELEELVNQLKAERKRKDRGEVQSARTKQTSVGRKGGEA